MKHVLLLAYDFPPRGSTSVFRIAKFARYLPAFGWRPVVVAAEVRGGLRDDGLLAQLPADLEIIRVANRFAPGGTGAPAAHSARPPLRARMRQQARRLFIPDAQMLWVPGAVRAASERLRHGDIAALVSTAPPYSVHMAALWLKRRFPDLPWIMDLRDIWSENPAIHSLIEYRLQRACERACVAAADRVVTATDGQRAIIQQAFGVPDARIRTITNGFDPADLAPDPPPADRAADRGPLRITHAGSIIGNRATAARGLFAALDMLQRAGVSAAELELRLIGIHDPRIYAWAEPFVAAGLVRLLPFVPQAEAYADMLTADVLLLLASDDREGRVSHPNKLFEYFGVGRPVLALAPDGDVTRLVREAGVGDAIAPSDSATIAATIRRLIAARRDGSLPRFGMRHPRFRRFERRALTQELAALLDELAP